MKIVVTAGNTQVPIDRVRCITNIFTGKTGTSIALEAHRRGHDVRLLTSNPEVVQALTASPPRSRWNVEPYRTFGELESRMGAAIRDGGADAVIHSAAVSDYTSAGIFAPSEHTRFGDDLRWESGAGTSASLVDRGAGKVKSDAPELWLRLVRTPKLIDRVRGDWRFKGTLVKFKLEVGLGGDELLRVAEASRTQSRADLMVANTLEGSKKWALIGPLDGKYEHVQRAILPRRLLDILEK
jgi:phosphopantothenoylcysteine synthetase/decarboxylase